MIFSLMTAQATGVVNSEIFVQSLETLPKELVNKIVPGLLTFLSEFYRLFSCQLNKYVLTHSLRVIILHWVVQPNLISSIGAE